MLTESLRKLSTLKEYVHNTKLDPTMMLVDT